MDEELNQPIERIMLQNAISIWGEAYANDYGPHLRKVIEVGMLVPGEHYLQAQRVRAQFRKDATALLDDVDILITPATATAAPKDRSTTCNPVFQASWTSTALPSIGIPCGADSEGMPIGIQLIPSPFAESDLLKAAQWCESVLDVKLMPPSLGD